MDSRRTRRRRMMVLAGLLAAAVALLASRRLLVEEWQIRRLHSESKLVQAEAARRLGEMRSRRAVPYLCEMLVDPKNGLVVVDEGLDLSFDELLGREERPEDDIYLSYEALRALLGIRPPPEEVLPSFFEALEKGNLSVMIGGGRESTEEVRALAEFVKEEPLRLLEPLRGSSERAIVAALAAGRLRAAEPEILDALLARVRDGDEGLRAAFAWVLAQYGPEIFPRLLDTVARVGGWADSVADGKSRRSRRRRAIPTA